jgi:hypothetical protein
MSCLTLFLNEVRDETRLSLQSQPFRREISYSWILELRQ